MAPHATEDSTTMSKNGDMGNDGAPLTNGEMSRSKVLSVCVHSSLLNHTPPPRPAARKTIITASHPLRHQKRGFQVSNSLGTPTTANH
jgi:hypothetical protein